MICICISALSVPSYPSIFNVIIVVIRKEKKTGTFIPQKSCTWRYCVLYFLHALMFVYFNWISFFVHRNLIELFSVASDYIIRSHLMTLSLFFYYGSLLRKLYQAWMKDARINIQVLKVFHLVVQSVIISCSNDDFTIIVPHQNNFNSQFTHLHPQKKKNKTEQKTYKQKYLLADKMCPQMSHKYFYIT